MKILLTGGTGFIGRHLLASLANQTNHELFVLVRNLQKIDPQLLPAISPLSGDLLSLPALPPDLDIVFHLAGVTKASKSADYYTVNYHGTASLFHGLRFQQKRVKFILLSSLAAAGPATSGRPVREDDPPAPINPYGHSKRLGEEETLRHRYRFSVAIIRVGGVYGPWDKDFLAFFRYLRRGLLPVFDSGRMRLTLCYVKDLVQALLLTASSDLRSGEILHVGDPQPYSWEEVGKTAAAILQKRVFKISLPRPLVFTIAALSQGISTITGRASVINLDKYREMKAALWVADVSKAQKILGIKPAYTLEDGLRETLSWYQEKGWL